MGPDPGMVKQAFDLDQSGQGSLESPGFTLLGYKCRRHSPTPGQSCGLDFKIHLKRAGCLGFFNILAFTEEKSFPPPNEHGIGSTIPHHLVLTGLKMSCRSICFVETDVSQEASYFYLFIFIEATMLWMLNHFISFDFINLHNYISKEIYCLYFITEETKTW